MAAHQRLFGGLLALEPAVHPGGVKIGKPSLDKGVDHLFGRLDVDRTGIIRVGQRQPHQAEPQFFRFHSYLQM